MVPPQPHNVQRPVLGRKRPLRCTSFVQTCSQEPCRNSATRYLNIHHVPGLVIFFIAAPGHTMASFIFVAAGHQDSTFIPQTHFCATPPDNPLYPRTSLWRLTGRSAKTTFGLGACESLRRPGVNPSRRVLRFSHPVRIQHRASSRSLSMLLL